MMYAIIGRRTHDATRQAETNERAEREYFPKLRAAPGFQDLYLVAGDDGLTTAVMIWEDRARADAFMAENQWWMQALEEMGNRMESRTGGDVRTHVTAGG